MQNGSARNRSAFRAAATNAASGTATAITHTFHQPSMMFSIAAGHQGERMNDAISASSGRNNRFRQPIKRNRVDQSGRYHRISAPSRGRMSAGEARVGGAGLA